MSTRFWHFVFTFMAWGLFAIGIAKSALIDGWHLPINEPIYFLVAACFFMLAAIRYSVAHPKTEEERRG